MFLQIPPSWKSVLQSESDAQYFSDLDSTLSRLYADSNINIFPAKEEIFKAYEHCALDEIKVVILGQDPYPTKNHAHGLCFSVQKEVKPFPKSLNNIFKELKEDVDVEIPEHGNLEHWSKQGVFLLNSILSVEEGNANSHAKLGWQKFTDKTIELISSDCENVVFILWGAKAIAKKKLINTNKHYILESVHPSPLSSYRGFFGSKPFSKANDYLKSKGLSVINW